MIIKIQRSSGRPVVRPNRITISLSDDVYSLVESFSEFTGDSKAKIIDSWLSSVLDSKREQLNHIKLILEEEALAKG